MKKICMYAIVLCMLVQVLTPVSRSYALEDSSESTEQSESQEDSSLSEDESSESSESEDSLDEESSSDISEESEGLPEESEDSVTPADEESSIIEEESEQPEESEEESEESEEESEEEEESDEEEEEEEEDPQPDDATASLWNTLFPQLRMRMMAKAAGGRTYESELAKFPSSYQSYLKTLHEKHPNWIFVATDTGLNWADAVAAESSNNRSVVPNSSSPLVKSNKTGDYNTATSSYIFKDSNVWVSGNEAIVAYYMDPRNFLTDNYIWMFENLAYDSLQNTSAVQSILNNTFMAGTVKYYDKDGKLITPTPEKTYAELIYQAGSNLDVSPVYLASKIIQEVGSGGSASVTGTSGLTYNGNSLNGYYNFYNIGASDSSNPITKGLAWAAGYPNANGEPTTTSYGRPWVSPVLSIYYGAQFIAQSYISVGQNTGYLMRFNVLPSNASSRYSHQYMTAITGAASEATSTYSSNSRMGTLDVQRIFYIPVYNNMPSLTEKPAISGTNGTATVKSTGATVINMRNQPSVGSGYVAGIPVGTKVTIVDGAIDNTTYTGISNKLNYPYWFKVTATVSGKSYTGYICADFLDFGESKSVAAGSSFKLSLKSTPSQTVYYQTSDPAIATVDASGNVKGVKAGNATIYCFTAAGIDAIGVKVTSGTASGGSTTTPTTQTKVNVSSLSIASIAAQNYTSKALTPALTVKSGSTTLKNGTDYTVSYSNNTLPGTATVTITGKGNYTGTRKVTFTINGTYTTYETTELLNYRKGPGTGYAVAGTLKKGASVSVLAGAYTTANGYNWYAVKINGTHYYVVGNYIRKPLVNLSSGSISVAGIADQAYAAKALSPAVTVKNGSTTLKNGTDYTLSYSNNTMPGTATVTITGKGGYTGSRKVTFKIVGKYDKYTTTAALNYRKGVGTGSAVAGTFKSGTTVEVLSGFAQKSGSYTWYAIKSGNTHYYAASAWLKKVATSASTTSGSKTSTSSSSSSSQTTSGYTKYTTTAALNYRKGAGTSYGVVGTFKSGTTVEVLNGYSKSANGYTWYAVKVGSNQYYVASTWLKKVATSTTTTTTSSSSSSSSSGSSGTTKYTTTVGLNYRSAAGLTGRVIGALSKGTAVQVVNGESYKANGYTWVPILLNGKKYYVASNYLKK